MTTDPLGKHQNEEEMGEKMEWAAIDPHYKIPNEIIKHAFVNVTRYKSNWRSTSKMKCKGRTGITIDYYEEKKLHILRYAYV